MVWVVLWDCMVSMGGIKRWYVWYNEMEWVWYYVMVWVVLRDDMGGIKK